MIRTKLIGDLVQETLTKNHLFLVVGFDAVIPFRGSYQVGNLIATPHPPTCMYVGLSEVQPWNPCSQQELGWLMIGSEGSGNFLIPDSFL